MESAKRIKLSECPMDVSDIDDFIVYDSADSDVEIDNRPVALKDIIGSCEVEDEIQTAVLEDLQEEEDDLKILLIEWGLRSFLDNLISCGVNFKRLELLEEADYHILMKNDYRKLGELAEFRKFHRKWKLDKQSQNTRRLNDVKYMLESGGEVAANIHAFYETNNCLIDPLRENLVDLILKEKRQIPRGILNEIADQICTIFSTEKKRVYYEKLKNKQPTGLLWRKYKDSREKKKTESQLPSDESQTEESDALLTDEVKKSIDFLNNEDNFGVNWNKSTISEHWTTTFLYRDSKVYKNFSQALDDWLPLRRADAPALIHCDFELKYGSDSAQSLLTKWENFTFRNQQEILRGIRDAKEKKVLQAAQCGTDLNAKNRTFVMALHQLSYTVPAHTTSEKNKHKITWAPTIPESKDAFLVVVNDSEELDKRLKLQYRLCELKNFKIHPVIFVMGKANNTRYVIALGSIRYECESLIDAVDDAFKIYVMMKIPFPPQCARVWLFLNELFYKIDLEQKPSAKIMSMLDSYQI